MNYKEWVNGKYTLVNLEGWFRDLYSSTIFKFMIKQNNTVFFEKMDLFLEMMRAKCKEYAVNDTECTFQSVLQRMNLTEGIRFEFNRFVFWSGYGDIFFSKCHFATFSSTPAMKPGSLEPSSSKKSTTAMLDTDWLNTHFALKNISEKIIECELYWFT